MPKYKITTLGCKVNQSESDAIAMNLKSCHWMPAEGSETSEICIINTCTVTQRASMQSRQAVRQAIRANPNCRIVVTGCYAQTEPEAFKKIKGIHYLIGNTDKHRIVEIIAADRNTAAEHSLSSDTDVQPSPPLKRTLKGIAGSRTRPFFKIQDGCNAFCTYCIVPRARGPSRSLPVGDVLEGIKALSNAGYQEIVLTGIHLGHYGLDLIPETNLSDLLDRIAGSNLATRVRLSSIEPLELTDDLIDRIADASCYCHHFHIPLQSGDNQILKKMKRPYTVDYFKQLVSKIHNHIPDAAIGVDTLVGFPGETDAAFENTYELIGELPITYLHVFPFSTRPGTPAAQFPDKVAPTVVKKRSKQLRHLGNTKRMNFYREFIGKELEVLIESTRHPQTGLAKGVSSNYIPVLIDTNEDCTNKLLSVRLTDLVDNAVRGTIV